MTAENIIVNGETMTVEVKPVTLICHKGDMKLEFPERIPLDPEQTVYHGRRVKSLHKDTERLVKPFFAEKIDTLGYWHVLGLIDLSLKLRDMGVPFAWVLPETYLHPSQQVELADVAVLLMKGGADAAA